MTRNRSALLLIPVLLCAACAMWWGDRSTSATFDELVMTSIGVRGWAVGDWSMVVDQPPLMPALYGGAVMLTGPRLPDEAAAEWSFNTRWSWGRALYFTSGNDPRVIASAGRAVSILLALLLVAGVWWIGVRAISPLGGLIAALITALSPDVLAHGPIAYNDLPMALAFLVAVWSTDRCVRAPTLATGALAGLAGAFAFGVKYSAIAWIPVAGLLLMAEAWSRWGDSQWRSRLLAAAGGMAGAFWASTALLYGGDLTLRGLRLGFWITVQRALEGHPAPAWLFGATSDGGWAWFFPVAFLIKNPIALIVLILGGVGLLWRGVRSGAGGSDPADEPRLLRVKRWVQSPLRAPAIGGLVFIAFLIRSSQNAGFRYALPVLPLVALLAAAGWARWIESGGGAAASAGPRRRAMVPLVLMLGTVVSLALSAPFLISYTSEWARRPAGQEALLDSSMDWGQGLLALRGWMQENQVHAVRLSHFGSAVPEAYGIDYAPLPSFLNLREGRTAGATGEILWTAISATNLSGLYFQGDDPFAAFRERDPDHVVGGSIYLYRDPAPAPVQND